MVWYLVQYPVQGKGWRRQLAYMLIALSSPSQRKNVFSSLRLGGSKICKIPVQGFLQGHRFLDKNLPKVLQDSYPTPKIHT